MRLEDFRPETFLTPAELAEIDARSEAMVQRADLYERMLEGRVASIKRLRGTIGGEGQTEGMEMLCCLACVIALEQLRCAALGVPEPSWQEALTTYDVLTQATIDKAIKPIFRKEASSS